MDMIKKLHRQFILLATLAVFIIIAVALSVINGMMYLIVRGGTFMMCLRPSQTMAVSSPRGA